MGGWVRAAARSWEEGAGTEATEGEGEAKGGVPSVRRQQRHALFTLTLTCTRFALSTYLSIDACAQETLLSGAGPGSKPEAWHELLKLLNLYSQDVLSRKVRRLFGAMHAAARPLRSPAVVTRG